jgi:hypothetical protein
LLPDLYSVPAQSSTFFFELSSFPNLSRPLLTLPFGHSLELVFGLLQLRSRPSPTFLTFLGFARPSWTVRLFERIFAKVHHHATGDAVFSNSVLADGRELAGGDLAERRERDLYRGNRPPVDCVRMGIGEL